MVTDFPERTFSGTSVGRCSFKPKRNIWTPRERTFQGSAIITRRHESQLKNMPVFQSLVNLRAYDRTKTAQFCFFNCQGQKLHRVSLKENRKKLNCSKCDSCPTWQTTKWILMFTLVLTRTKIDTQKKEAEFLPEFKQYHARSCTNHCSQRCASFILYQVKSLELSSFPVDHKAASASSRSALQTAN